MIASASPIQDRRLERGGLVRTGVHFLARPVPQVVDRVLPLQSDFKIMEGRGIDELQLCFFRVEQL